MFVMPSRRVFHSYSSLKWGFIESFLKFISHRPSESLYLEGVPLERVFISINALSPYTGNNYAKFKNTKEQI